MKTITLPMDVALDIHALLVKLKYSAENNAPITVNGELMGDILNEFEYELCRDKDDPPRGYRWEFDRELGTFDLVKNEDENE